MLDNESFYDICFRTLGQLLFHVASGQRPNQMSEEEIVKTMKRGQMPPYN
jgi:hypothetical protein